MSETKKSLFDTLYDGAKEGIKKMQAPLVERAYKRKFASMYDDAERIIDETNLALFAERQRLNEGDINTILKLKREIAKANELRKEIAVEYKEMFGEDIK